MLGVEMEKLNNNYTLSFTVGAGLIAESVKTAKLFCGCRDWVQVREQVVQENLFQSRTQNTLIKLYREVHRRLVLLSRDEIELLALGSEMDKRHVIWLAICLKYILIKDFALEVLMNRYDSAQYSLSYVEYDRYFDDKSDVFANLANASTTTKNKARQVIFKMMSECGLLDEDWEIRPQHLSKAFRQVVRDAGHHELSIFPGVGAWK